jgi:hypothetical protein
LKEIFGESSEGSEGRRQEVGTLGEIDEVGRIGATSRAGGSVDTSEGVTRESELITQKFIREHYEVEGILQDHVTPILNNFILLAKDQSPSCLLPQCHLKIW